MANYKDSTELPAQSTIASSLPESPQEYNHDEYDRQGDATEEGDGTSDTELGNGQCNATDEMSDSEALQQRQDSAPDEILVTEQPRQTQSPTFEDSTICMPKEDDILNSDGTVLSAAVTIESEPCFTSDLERSKGKDPQQCLHILCTNSHYQF